VAAADHPGRALTEHIAANIALYDRTPTRLAKGFLKILPRKFAAMLHVFAGPLFAVQI
jgi:hypothetical protein